MILGVIEVGIMGGFEEDCADNVGKSARAGVSEDQILENRKAYQYPNLMRCASNRSREGLNFSSLGRRIGLFSNCLIPASGL